MAELLQQRDFQTSDYFDFNLLLFGLHLGAYYVGQLLRKRSMDPSPIRSASR